MLNAGFEPNIILQDASSQGREIPVISDIERIKKIIEVVEFIGDKFENVFPPAQPSPNSGSTREIANFNEKFEISNGDIDTTTIKTNAAL